MNRSSRFPATSPHTNIFGILPRPSLPSSVCRHRFCALRESENEDSLRPMHSQQARWAAFCCLQLAWMPSCSAKVDQGFAPAPVPLCPLLFPFCAVCCCTTASVRDPSYLCQVQTAAVMPHGDFVYAPDLVGFRNGSRELNAAAKVWRPRACQASPATRFHDERLTSLRSAGFEPGPGWKV